MKYITIALGIILACLAFLPYNYGEMRTHKETRYATMIDTYATHSSHKGNHSYNVRGLFRDKLTGKVFGDSINDSLYRQFERDGNKPIEVSWPYDIDKMEQTSIGIFAIILGELMWFFSALLIIFGVVLFFLKDEKK
jgi:hypothetical protein